MKKSLLFLLAPILLGASPTHEPCYKADIIFVIDYSDSMSEHVKSYEPWLRATAGQLPLSSHLKAGLIFFSSRVCPVECPLTDDKILFDGKIALDPECPLEGTFIMPALYRAEEMFNESQKQRKEAVPRIIVIVTDSDVGDEVVACGFIDSKMTDVFFIVMNLKSVFGYERINKMRECMLHNGIMFDGFVWIYEDLLKQFDPCM